MDYTPQTIPSSLDRIDSKDEVDDLFRLLVGDLKRIAQNLCSSYISARRARATELVSKLYCELSGIPEVPREKGDFLRFSALVMRRIVVRDLRRRHTLKRGGDTAAFPLEYARNIAQREDLDLPTILTLDASLDRLAQDHPILSALVDMRFFVGLTIHETAEALSLSPATVKRYWQQAVELIREDLLSSPQALTFQEAQEEGEGPEKEGGRRGRRTGHSPPGPDGVPFLEHPIFKLLEQEDCTLRPGDSLGSYVVDHLIGSGGMSEVYLAYRTGEQARRRYAVKVLRADRSVSELVRERFEKEGELDWIEHPALVQVVDRGVTPCRRPFLVTHYVEGSPIDDHCRKPGIDTERKLRLFEELCEPVAHLHAKDVVHGDLNPSNVLVTAAGRIRLIDLGASLSPWRTYSRELRFLQRSEAYAGPERLRGHVPTPASDVYSLGVLLIEMLTGRVLQSGSLDSTQLRDLWGGARPKLATMILERELASVGSPQTPLTDTWDAAKRCRRDSLRLAKLVGPILERALAPDPLHRIEIEELRRLVGDARRVCVRSRIPHSLASSRSGAPSTPAGSIA